MRTVVVFHFENFHDRSFADYEPCGMPVREPDFVSRSGSVYWDEGDRVIRMSDHWGPVRSCYWLYSGLRNAVGERVAVCRYQDFGRLERLTIERDRSIPVRPGSRPSLVGQRISIAPKSGGRRVIEVVAETPFRLEAAGIGWLPRYSRCAAWLVE